MIHVSSSSYVVKSENDKRDYCHITLSNKLDCLLISDSLADKAAAALDVKVGYFNDPDDLAGLAHFCEHLSFMGTKTYPEENDYSKYLASHGGASNAFTSGEHTNYYFEVLSEYLEPTLDRFAEFFTHPLFLESSVERELMAIDSEHKKNLQSDIWTLFQLLKDFSDDSHPFSKFGTGNLETLKHIPAGKGIDIRKELLKFHEQYYSANKMKLVVYGKESIEKLKEMVTTKFSSVPNKDLATVSYGVPIKKDLLQTLLRVKPIKDLKNLYLIFQTLVNENDYFIHPFNYLSHLIGHESEGSILSLLKSKGLANGLSAGLSGYGGSGFDFFQIKIELTDSGLERFEDVSVIALQYLKMLSEDGIQEWIFQEIRQMNQIFFRFKEKTSPSSYSSSLAGNMHLFAPEHYLNGSYLMEEYKPDLLRHCLSILSPENVIMLLQANTPFWTEEKKAFPKLNWYDTIYCEESLSDELYQKLQTVHRIPELHLPNSNKFLPQKFDLSPIVHPSLKRTPFLLLDNKFIRLWHRQDDRFLVPKGNIALEIKSGLAYETVSGCVMTNLFSLILKDVLNEFSYYAEIAGLAFSLENSTSGLVLLICGYSDKLHVLLKEILCRMTSFNVEKEQFSRILNKLIQKTKNWYQDAPHTHAIYYTTYFTQERLFTAEEKLEVMNTVTGEQVAEFSRRLIDSCYIEGLVHGNYSTHDALSIGRLITEMLPATNPTCPVDLQTVVIPEASNFIVQLPVFNPANQNSAIEYAVQIGNVSDPITRCLVTLLVHLAKEPAFNTLRTREQLGYIVHTRTRNQSEMISFSLIIQSEHDPLYLESRIESFLSSFELFLASMSPQDLQKYKDSLSKTYLEEIKNLSQEFNRIWSHIQSSYYNFQQYEQDAAKLQELTLAQVIDFFQTKVHPSAQNRRKVSVHMQRQKPKQTYSESEHAEMDRVLQRTTAHFDELAKVANHKASCPLGGVPSGQQLDMYRLDLYVDGARNLAL